MDSPSLNLKPRDFGPIRLGVLFEKTIIICQKNSGDQKKSELGKPYCGLPIYCQDTENFTTESTLMSKVPN
jgi:hypothetical protein